MHVRLRAALVVLSSVLIAVSCDEAGDLTDPVDPVAVETGSLPSGLTLAPAGSISGTAIAPGTSSFRVRATDADGRNATADLSIAVVQALAVHTASLTYAVAGEDYSAELQSVGGRGTHTWSLTDAGTATTRPAPSRSRPPGTGMSCCGGSPSTRA